VEGKNGMTVYVKIDEYRDIVDLVNLMRTKIGAKWASRPIRVDESSQFFAMPVCDV